MESIGRHRNCWWCCCRVGISVLVFLRNVRKITTFSPFFFAAYYMSAVDFSPFLCFVQCLPLFSLLFIRNYAISLQNIEFYYLHTLRNYKMIFRVIDKFCFLWRFASWEPKKQFDRFFSVKNEPKKKGKKLTSSNNKMVLQKKKKTARKKRKKMESESKVSLMLSSASFSIAIQFPS